MSDYIQFLESKRIGFTSTGFEVDPAAINPILFPFQRDIVRWAIRKGRAAIFLDTGLGKTFVQLEWARLIGQRTMIVAPLSVARQTVNEARKIGIDVRYVRAQEQMTDDCQLYITNYEMVIHFDPTLFGAVVLDESSILKSLDGKMRAQLTSMFAQTPYRLCCTATPAPNDVTEIGRHAEFLGIMTNAEMLAAFFINDQKQKDGTYRLKGHAVNRFYEWLSSWGIAVKRPSDIGYDDTDYILPPLHVEHVLIDATYTPEGMLPGFNVGSLSAIEAKTVRRETVEERIEKTASWVNASNEQWVIWAGLNAEAEALNAAIPGSINIHGSLSPDEKADGLERFVNGDVRVLITKTSIAGFGINMQRCHNTVFCGIDYSWESYYQAVRRFYRFGQTEQVNVYVVVSSADQSVFEKVLGKEQEALKMTDELVKRSANYSKAELTGKHDHNWSYKTAEKTGQNWGLMLGDSCERIDEIEDESVDLSVFSPPFISLYTYTPTERDLGNSRNSDEFFEHFAPVIHGLLRITKQGRNCCVHVQQVAATKIHDGYIGIKDFRGDVIRAFTAAGFVFHGEVTIDKNPQVQAIRTKTKGLMFQQLHKDSVANRPAFADYLLIFQKPGENLVPVIPTVTNEEWIQWAHPIWYDIKESAVLNVEVARADRDERHMCPLQLPFIERCVKLYSNAGELVFSPFAGIGSEGYEAVRHGRQFLGIELKEEYWNVAARNLAEAERQKGQKTLFDLFTVEDAANG